MKKTDLCNILAISACCLFASLIPISAHADSVTMNFTGVGGANSGGVYTYPYYFNVDGGATVSLMCLSYLQDIQIPETWQATITKIGTATTYLSATEEEEDAYLDNVVLSKGSSAQTIADAQWAAWEVGDPALVGNLPAGLDEPGIAVQLGDAQAFVSTHTLANDGGFYSGFQLYVPDPGTQVPFPGDGLPQTFIGVAPEPGSLLLLGSGLLTLAGGLYRNRKRHAA